MDGTDFESHACEEQPNPSLPDHILHTRYPHEITGLAAANQCKEPYDTNNTDHPTAYPEGDVPNFLTQLATSNAPLSQAFCPHCGCFLNDISSTQTQQDVHILQCKDTYSKCELQPIQEVENNIQSEAEEQSDTNDDNEEEEEQQQQQQQQPSSSEEEDKLDNVNLAHSPTTTTTNTDPEHVLLQSWLDHHNLTKYSALFTQAGADLKLIPLLTDTDLRHMGITALGARKKILLAAHNLNKIQRPTSQTASHNDDAKDIDDVAGNSLKRYFPMLNPPPEKKKQTNNTTNDGTAAPPPPPPGSILNFVSIPPGAKIPPPKPPNNNKHSNSNAWAHKEATTADAGKTNTRRGFTSSRGPQPYKSWQLIPGTTFVVDRFNNLPPPSQHQTHWFLTHFHADHYRGLTGKWNRGPIYCTSITAALVKSQLRVRDEWIRVVEQLDVGVEVEGSVVTFIDANHCPGAVMIVFEGGVEGGGGGGGGVIRRRPVLHTGDARLVASMQDHPVLHRLRGSKCDLILDTTYANPEYDFPSQQEALQFALDAVKGKKDY
jgi:DNA cross-link repair 1A protein